MSSFGMLIKRLFLFLFFKFISLAVPLINMTLSKYHNMDYMPNFVGDDNKEEQIYGVWVDKYCLTSNVFYLVTLVISRAFAVKNQSIIFFDTSICLV